MDDKTVPPPSETETPIDSPLAGPEPFNGKKTIIKPRPGGQTSTTPIDDSALYTLRSAPPSAPLAVATSGQAPETVAAYRFADFSETLSPHSSINPLLHAAATLLSQTEALRSQTTAPSEHLFEDITREMNRFQQRAKEARCYDLADINTASELLSCFIDESVRKMPWREETQWVDKTLLFTLHFKHAGGDYFFNLTEQLLHRQDKNKLALIEFIFILLNLGFEGRYGLINNGHQTLLELRNRLYHQIVAFRGEPEKALSVNWQGSERAQEKLTSLWPLGLSMVAVVAVLMAVYAVLFLQLSRSAEPVQVDMNSLSNILSRDDVVMVDWTPPTTKSLHELLATDIAAGTLVVEQRGRHEAIVLEGDRYFASGSGSLKPESLNVIARIRDVLAPLSGSLDISGHTDNIPMRSLRFPSNFALSEARAQSVANALGLLDRSRVYGQGQSEPRFVNDSPENRARNRRVEILLLSAQ